MDVDVRASTCVDIRLSTSISTHVDARLNDIRHVVILFEKLEKIDYEIIINVEQY
jgi:hypothetical protein